MRPVPAAAPGRHPFGALALLVLATLASFAIVAVGSPSTAVACKHVHAPTRSLGKSEARHAMRCLINGTRKHHGARRLKRNGDLAHAAQRHTRRMRKKHCFAHQCPGEGNVLVRIHASGYLRGARRYSYAENIAKSARKRSSPRRVFKRWMHSSGHRANILASNSKHIGVGVSARHHKSWWTTDFGSHR